MRGSSYVLVRLEEASSCHGIELKINVCESIAIAGLFWG
jgi:hypothetical protein